MEKGIMREKIIQIACCVTGSYASSVYGLSEYGNLYRTNGSGWRLIEESPEHEEES